MNEMEGKSERNGRKERVKEMEGRKEGRNGRKEASKERHGRKE
jgi:hypothetical protein